VANYNAALQQTVEVLLRTGGKSDADALRDAMVKLNAEMTALAQASRSLGTPVSDMLKELAPLAAGFRQVKVALAELEKQEAATARATEEAAGKILRAKIDAYARAERAAEQAATTQERLDGEAMRARIEGYARAERAAEQAENAQVQSARESLAEQKRVSLELMADRQRLHDTTKAILDKERDEQIRAARDMLAAQKQSVIQQIDAASMLADQKAAALKRQEAEEIQVAYAAVARSKDEAAQIMAYGSLANKTKGDAAVEASLKAKASAATAAAASDYEKAVLTGNADKIIAAMDKVRKAQAMTAAASGDIVHSYDAMAAGSRRGAYAMLQFSYAAQDLTQSGFAAIVNNVPVMVNALNLSTSVAAGLMFGAVALDVAMKALGPVFKSLAMDIGLIDDPAQKFITNVDEMKAKLERLEAKPYKVDLDFDRIELAKKELTLMEERLSAFNAGKHDKIEQEISKETKEATHLYGGGTEEVEKIVEAHIRVRMAEGAEFGDPETRKRIEGLQYRVAHPTVNRETGESDEAESRRQLSEQQAKLNQQIRDLAKTEVGAFETGDLGAINRMKELAKSKPDLFSKKGLEGRSMGDAVAMLPGTREEQITRMNNEEKAKLHQKEVDDKEKQEEERAKKLKAESRKLEASQKDINDGNTAQDRERKARLTREARRTEAGLDQEDANAAAEAKDARTDVAQQKKDQRAMTAVERKRHADAAKLMSGGLGERVEAAILENKALLDAGNPNALAPGMLANVLRNKVGFDLAQGGKDPTLANEIVNQSRSHLQDRIVQAGSKTATTMDGVVDMQTITLHLLQETMGRLNHVEMQTHQNRNHARRLQNRGPSGQRTGG
jgi:hypothetical protein